MSQWSEAGRLTAVCSAALVAACGAADGGKAPEGWSGTVDSLEGVRVVSNPGEPAFGEGTLGMSRSWEASLGPDFGRRRVWEPAPVVRAGEHGRVFILDPADGTVHVLDGSSGRRLGSFPARRGEVGADSGAATDADEPATAMAVLRDRIVVGARRSRWLRALGSEGEPLAAASLDAELLELYRLDSTNVVSMVFRGNGAGWLRHGPDLEPRRYPALRPMPRGYPEAGERDCWKVGPGRVGLLLASCAYPVVVELDQQGRLALETHLDAPPDSTSEEELETLRAHARAKAEATTPDLAPRVVEWSVRRELSRHPLVKKHRGVRYVPRLDAIALWEQRPEYLGAGQAALHLFDAGGHYLASSETGDDWLDFDLRGRRLYAVVKGEEGASVVGYRLTLGEPLRRLLPAPETAAEGG